MHLHPYIDPESRGPLQSLLAQRPGFHDRPLNERRALSADPDAERPAQQDTVTTATISVAGPSGDQLPLRVYRPTTAPTAPVPVILYIHGGGMIMGSAALDDPIATMLSTQLGAVVVSVDYRLAPEHPYPAAVDDCQAALDWTRTHAGSLGADAGRLVILGGSAGGGLAIATALLARDRGKPPATLLMAFYPMIDDRGITPSSTEVTDLGAWDRRPNQQAWSWYLAGRPADQYSSPARATDLAGLPPTFIDVGTADLFRDEDIDFAQRLMQAGVPTELHVHLGAYHASELLAPEAALSRSIWALRLTALHRAVATTRSPHPARGAFGPEPVAASPR